MKNIKSTFTSILDQSKKTILIFSLFGGFFASAQSAAELGFVEGVNFNESVVFKTAGTTNVNMDIYFPDSSNLESKNPWVLFVHGGGWAGGDKQVIFKTAFIDTFKKLTESGVVVAVVGYRRARSPINSYESALDCKDATRFLIKNADKYGLDPVEYGIWGGSAGGHLSLVAALGDDASFLGDAELADISTNFKFVVSFYPFTSCLNPDLRPNSIFEDGTLFDRLLGGFPEEEPELARLLSPTEFLTENSPPLYLVHGEDDTTLPIINSTYLIEVAKEKNATAELLTVKNAEHSFGGNNISPTLLGIRDSSVNFMLSHLEFVIPTTLMSLKIEGSELEKFDPRVYDYDIELSPETIDVPEFTVIASDLNANVTVTPPTSLPGTTTILVSNEDGSSTYTFNFSIREVSTDASLFDISIEGTTLTDFHADKLNYTIVFDGDSTDIPVTTATALDQYAAVVINQASTVSETTTITVTAEDGSTISYTITYSMPVLLNSEEEIKIEIYPNPTETQLNINVESKIVSIDLINTYGVTIRHITNISLNKTSIDIRGIPSGYYFLSVKTINGDIIKKVRIK